LTTLRILETGDFPEKMVCRDEDFHSTLSMIRVLVRHASYIYSALPEGMKTVKGKNKKEQFLEGLPGKFTCQEFINIAKAMDITVRTANRYIFDFCDKGLLHRENQGSYINLMLGQSGHESSQG
ncbi:MAG TPA: hypothetical protein VFG54_20065, partial [Prolixibacteraceae bacterium]|nr:hypothetical protein [Prolixibacteraceae bacterium]